MKKKTIEYHLIDSFGFVASYETMQEAVAAKYKKLYYANIRIVKVEVWK